MPGQPASVPPDDLSRELIVARPDNDQSLPHLGLVGDTYTILVTGKETAGKYTLIDMHVPPGGGPPPHRHDFEEMFTVLDGEVLVTFRGETLVARAGETINVAQQPRRCVCGVGERVRGVGRHIDPSRSRPAGRACRPSCICTPACRTSTTPSPSTPTCRAVRKATATACCGACDSG